jgi:hypothetical protein
MPSLTQWSLQLQAGLSINEEGVGVSLLRNSLLFLPGGIGTNHPQTKYTIYVLVAGRYEYLQQPSQSDKLIDFQTQKFSPIGTDQSNRWKALSVGGNLSR